MDCGAGETTLRMFDDFGPVGWSPPSDAVGRAFLKSAPPSALGRAVQKAQAAYSCGERVAWVTPEDIERGRCKPSPVENARRYTSEEETW